MKTTACKFFYSFKSRLSPRDKLYISELKKLSRDKNLIVTKPDKGSGIVILNRVDYINNMENLLSDGSAFSKISTDLFKTVLKYEDKVNRFVDNLFKLKIVDLDTKSQLRCTGSRPGIMYGSPKVHKRNHPLRPILSTIGTCNYNISKFLVTLLSPVVDRTFVVQDSFQFSNDICNVPHNNGVMASFDVQSLFSNIPVSETCDLIVDKLFSDNSSKYSGFDKTNFRKLLDICCTNNIFIFNKQLYAQIDGAPMGGCVSPTLANFFLGHFENLWLKQCPKEFKPTYYKRYVDDTFLIFREKSHVNLFLDYINMQHPKINFTCEIEKNGTLPFLDVNVTKNESNSFTTGLYRKPTFTGLGLKFQSAVANSHKYNLIGCLLDRAHKICSNLVTFGAEVEKLKKYFFQNGYPIKLINDVVVGKVSELSVDKPLIPTVEKMNIYSSIPFLNSSDNRSVYKDIQKIVNDFFPQINLKIVFKNSHTVGSYFKFKDSIPDLLCSNVVYKYSCAQCSATYYGETTRHISTRIAEHKGLSVRTGKPVTNPLNSSIRNHSLETGHDIPNSSFSIVFSTNSHNLRVSESILINQNSPSLNNTESSIPLNILI